MLLMTVMKPQAKHRLDNKDITVALPPRAEG